MTSIITKINAPKITKLKTNILIHIVFVFLIFSSLKISAQAPGYMGKRLLIGLEAPLIAGYDRKSDDFSYKEIKSDGSSEYVRHEYSQLYFRIKPSLTIEYVLNRKSSFQLFGQYSSSKVDVYSFSDTVNSNRVTFYPSSRVKANTTSFGLRYKLFKKSGLNPVGRYVMFGIEYASTKFKVEDEQFSSGSYHEVVYRAPIGDKASTIIPTFGFGTQQPVGQDLILNFGMNFGIPFSTFKDFSSNPKSEDWAESNIPNNNWKSSLVNLVIGIAFLP